MAYNQQNFSKRKFYFNHDVFGPFQLYNQTRSQQSAIYRAQTFFSNDLPIPGYENKVFWTYGMKIAWELAEHGFMHLTENKISCPYCYFTTTIEFVNMIIDIDKEIDSINILHKDVSHGCIYYSQLLFKKLFRGLDDTMRSQQAAARREFPNYFFNKYDTIALKQLFYSNQNLDIPTYKVVEYATLFGWKK